MHDFNFFESIASKNKRQNASQGSYNSLMILLAVLVAAWPLFNLGYSYKLNRDIESLKNEVTLNQKYPLLEQAQAIRQYLEERGSQLAALKKADSEVKASEWLNEAFLYDLLSKAPRDMRIDMLTVAPEKAVLITGSAKNKPAIAELERRLRDCGRFRDLNVDTIDNKDGVYTFNMNLVLKDVN
ncbi:MAG TPA: hypothetical protein VN549_03990 [Negativicutes bacterium]|nr:hypothetical protein [Negativicutes bacterium]